MLLDDFKRLWMQWRLRKYTKYIAEDQTLTTEEVEQARLLFETFDWDSIN